MSKGVDVADAAATGDLVAGAEGVVGGVQEAKKLVALIRKAKAAKGGKKRKRDAPKDSDPTEGGVESGDRDPKISGDALSRLTKLARTS